MNVTIIISTISTSSNVTLIHDRNEGQIPPLHQKMLDKTQVQCNHTGKHNSNCAKEPVLPLMYMSTQSRPLKMTAHLQLSCSRQTSPASMNPFLLSMATLAGDNIDQHSFT
jgi:hypothetical protein